MRKIGLRRFLEKVTLNEVNEIDKFNSKGPNNHGRGKFRNKAITPPKVPSNKAT